MGRLQKRFKNRYVWKMTPSGHVYRHNIYSYDFRASVCATLSKYSMRDTKQAVSDFFGYLNPIFQDYENNR